MSIIEQSGLVFTVKVAEVEWSTPSIPAAVFPLINALIITVDPVDEVAFDLRILIVVPDVVAHMAALVESQAKLMVHVV